MRSHFEPNEFMKNKDIEIKNKLERKERFKISRFKEAIKRTKPHKHDGYFELIYLSEGAGFHWIDTEKFQITPPVVFVLSEQLHYWEMTAVPKGFVLLFKEDFIDQIRDSTVINLIRPLQDSSEIRLGPDDNIEFLFREMEKEHSSPSNYSKEVIHGYLQAALAKLLTIKTHQRQAGLNGNSQFQKFQQLLHSAYPISNLKVLDLAKRMHISPQNLNLICRRASGKAASELITEQVILESKRYILHTDKTISEISQALKFSDPSHFIKYFKKHTSETPQQFREKHFQ